MANLLPIPFQYTSQTPLTRSTSPNLIKFLHNLIFQSTHPLPFEDKPNTIYTFPLIREHHHSYLYFLHSHQLIEPLPEEPHFTIVFNPIPNVSDEIHTLPIHPKNIFIPIEKVFLQFLTTLTDYNNDLDQPIFFLLLLKLSFLKNLSLLLIISKLAVLLKIILTIGSKQISFNSKTFIIIFSPISHSIMTQFPKSKSTLSFSENSSVLTINSYGMTKTYQHTKTFPNISLLMNFFHSFPKIQINMHFFLISPQFHPPFSTLFILTICTLMILLLKNLPNLCKGALWSLGASVWTMGSSRGSHEW